jgi:hypothetical protein
LPPHEFWDQVPATYNAIMLGRHRSRQDDWERSLFIAYQSAAFAREPKLKSFDKYLAKMRPKVKSTVVDLRVAFEAMAASGFNIRVRKL